MPIPDFQSLMLPLLEAIADGSLRANREIAATLAARFQLSDTELNEMLPSGESKVFANRVAWAKAHLKRAGLLESPQRATYRLTERGRSVLTQSPAKIDIRFLRQFEEYDWHKPKVADRVEDIENESDSTPEEQLDASIRELRAALADDLLEQVKGCSPRFFERLVVELLVAMGYGGSLSDAGQAIGRSGDGGIDGIIKEDRLGLDFVCIQAKRWENTVGRPAVQAFAGSMEGFRARKGVLITTGSFSKDAEDYVARIERKIVLIDGKRLAELMIDHNVGVATARTYTVKRIDLDYFVEEEG